MLRSHAKSMKFSIAVIVGANVVLFRLAASQRRDELIDGRGGPRRIRSRDLLDVTDNTEDDPSGGGRDVVRQVVHEANKRAMDYLVRDRLTYDEIVIAMDEFAMSMSMSMSIPTVEPTSPPQETEVPTADKTVAPSLSPGLKTSQPTQSTTLNPTRSPETQRPDTAAPSISATGKPSEPETSSPTSSPAFEPSMKPVTQTPETTAPTSSTSQPTAQVSETRAPTVNPTPLQPSLNPSTAPISQTRTPTLNPTLQPSLSPVALTDTPTTAPSPTPSQSPQQASPEPTNQPSPKPSESSSEPSPSPTLSPRSSPSATPSELTSSCIGTCNELCNGNATDENIGWPDDPPCNDNREPCVPPPDGQRIEESASSPIYDPVNDETTFLYDVYNDGGSPDISHVVLSWLGDCCIVEYSPVTSGDTTCGEDNGKTCDLWGIKFDSSAPYPSEPEVFTIVVKGNIPSVPGIPYALKKGNGFCYGNVTGPDCTSCVWV